MFGGIVVGAAGCVDAFDGSKLVMTLQGAHVAGEPARFAPPTGTHYELHAVRDGRSIELARFAIRPVIERDEPCFIELFPPHAGMHVTQVAARVELDAGADGEISDAEAATIHLARQRVAALPALEAVKAIVSHDGDARGRREELRATLPPVEAIDDVASAARLTSCQAFWAEHPDYYVGSDGQQFLPPRAGRLHGFVDGVDPRSLSAIGSAIFETTVVLADLDAVRVTWQFDDPADPRVTEYELTAIGHPYLSGVPEARTRGTAHAALRHLWAVEPRGELAFFADVGGDDVHF